MLMYTLSLMTNKRYYKCNVLGKGTMDSYLMQTRNYGSEMIEQPEESQLVNLNPN